MTLHAALSSEQVGLGSTVPQGCQSWAQFQAQCPVTPTPSRPGRHGIDATPISLVTPLCRAVVRLTLREWLDALVECDALSGWSVKAATGLMPSRPRARRRIGTSPEAFRVGPASGESENLLRPGGVSLGRIGESAEARVVVPWLWYLQGLSNFFGSCLGYPFLWYPTHPSHNTFS